MRKHAIEMTLIDKDHPSKTFFILTGALTIMAIAAVGATAMRCAKPYDCRSLAQANR